jgi:hypothetical protein
MSLSVNKTKDTMKRGISLIDGAVEILAAAAVIALYAYGKIGIGYAVLGVIVSLSLMWPFKTGSAK